MSGDERSEGEAMANELTKAGRAAMRAMLLDTLKANRWNLTATGKALGMGGPPAVIRAIKHLGLRSEYAAIQASGAMQRGRPRRLTEPRAGEAAREAARRRGAPVTAPDLAAIEAAARACAPSGAWEATASMDTTREAFVLDANGDTVATTHTADSTDDGPGANALAEFVATATPDAVLALVAEVRAARAALAAADSIVAAAIAYADALDATGEDMLPLRDAADDACDELVAAVDAGRDVLAWEHGTLAPADAAARGGGA